MQLPNLVKTDDELADPNVALFDPAKTQQALDALDKMIPDTASGFYRRFDCVGKSRWLSNATRRNLAHQFSWNGHLKYELRDAGLLPQEF